MPRERRNRHLDFILIPPAVLFIFLFFSLYSGLDCGLETTLANASLHRDCCSTNDVPTQMSNNESDWLSLIDMHEENSTLWGFTGSIDGLVERTVERKWWGPAMARDAEGSLDEWTLSNVSCTRLTEANVSVRDMAERYARHRAVKDATGCDTLSVPFNPLMDAPCIRYMTNVSNWDIALPLSQLKRQRSIKFLIRFKPLRLSGGRMIENPVRTVVKVPQRLFPREAGGEVLAFYADRLLRVHRTPPTGFACFPVQFILDSLERSNWTAEVDEALLKEAGVRSYRELVEKDMLGHLQETEQLSNMGSGDGQCFGASIQLMIADDNPFSNSSMSITHKPYSSKWFSLFNLKKEKNWRDHRPTFLQKPNYVAVLHLAQLSMLDYVVGNGDRSPVKNNHIVGGTGSAQLVDDTALLHPNSPTFVYIDQGLSFARDHPRHNPITASVKLFHTKGIDTFCLFRGPLLRRIRELMRPSGASPNETLFEAHMRRLVPRDVLKRANDRLPFVSMRGRELLNLAGRCLADSRIQAYVLFP
uniref:Uncharacterized protein n=1 Tax=Trypanosoma vivax (strain Y486) TaxID=1055687 RepID=G0TXX5_TRYVY|nr:conserved hypothetical protein [Trypanosoma vivax Y486]